MFQNNIKFAIRNLTRNRSYSLINILGLTVGVGAVLLLFRMVTYEYSFNQVFENYEHLGRVIRLEPYSSGNSDRGPGMPIPAMDVIEETVPGLAKLSRIRETWPYFTIPAVTPDVAMKKFKSDRGETPLLVEPAFFDMFGWKWISVPAAAAMAEPNRVVLTRSWAEKCFGSVESAINQTMMMDNIYPVNVVGVIEELPSNCDFSFPFLLSYKTIEGKEDYLFYGDSWGSTSSNDQMYVLLEEGTSLDNLNASLAEVGKEEYTEDDVQRRIHAFQPLSDLHFNEDLGHSGTHTTSKGRLKVLALIGLLILVMACFNFINLANAQATLRAKEVGVRKTLGGRRWQLAIQFLTETGMIVLVALLMGVALGYLALPLLQKVSRVPVTEPLLSGGMSYAFVALLGLALTVLAGLYPSLALASFKPVEALKNKLQSSVVAASGIRRSLVVLQFMIAQALIICIIIALVQLKFIRSQDLGFQEDLVYTFGFNSDSSTMARQSALKQSLLQLPEVSTVSLSSDQPLSGSTWISNFAFDNRPEDEDFGISMKFCDTDYQETYNIAMLAGRWLAPSDTVREAVVNNTVVSKLGFSSPDEVLDKNLKLGGKAVRVVGVSEDFHTHSFRNAHLPLMMTTRKEFYWEAGVKIRPHDVDGAVASIKRVYDEVLPEQVFTGRFLEENIAAFYRDDERLASACWGFGVLAIFICCLGLFGLAAHSAARRKKEIGIRKVLGARVIGIISLLSRDFILMVVIAFLVAAPLAWYLMTLWLNDFVFRVGIPWWSYALAGFVTIVIAFFTVGLQTGRAALDNPIKSLQSE